MDWDTNCGKDCKSMKEKLTNKLTNNGILKLISVGLALFLWIVVINAENPYETKNLTIRNIEYLNENVVLTSNQTYTVEALDQKGVDISVRVRRKDSGKVRSSDFCAQVDLAQIGPFGSAEVKVKWLGSNQYELAEEDISWKTKTVKVTLEEIMTMEYPVKINLSGKPVDSYIVGDYTSDPRKVVIVAPESLQAQIQSVGIEVNIDGMNADVEGTATLKLYDVTGSELKLDVSEYDAREFSISAKEIRYHVPLLKIKEVILRTNGYVGTVAEGYRYTGMAGANQTAYIAGYRNVLAEVDAIDIPAEALNLDGATANKEIQIDLSRYVPEGVTVESSTIVTVVMMVEPLVQQERELQPSKIRMEGMQEGYEYKLQGSVKIWIEGLQEDLNTLSNDKIDAWIQVKDLVPGTSEVEVHINVANAFEVIRVAKALVVVEAIQETEESTENGTLESPEKETTGADDESTDADVEETTEAADADATVESTESAPEAESTAGSTES